MSTFVILGRLTQKALAHMDRAAERDASGDRIIEATGGRVLAHYYTFGQYDFMVIAELPSADALARALMEMGRYGTVTTESMTALTPDEVYRAVKAG